MDQKKDSSYENCLKTAKERIEKGELSLCARGYCSAKHRFEKYPSAYANAYASNVCKGRVKGFDGIKQENSTYISQKKGEAGGLRRWFDEEWVNLCEKGDGPGGFKPCGTGEGVNNPEKYPYCRAYHKLPDTSVITVEELQQYFPVEFEDLISEMCSKKQSIDHSKDIKPTRVTLPEHVHEKVKSMRQTKGGRLTVSPKKNGFYKDMIKIPPKVKNQAVLGLRMIGLGFKGGTQTGWDRAEQLAYESHISADDIADMRTWFARHGPDASNGGTSYTGYCKWITDGKPLHQGYGKYRGAVAWLIWGGDDAYEWLKQKDVRELLNNRFPNRKISETSNNLGCTF